jgi:hypothetical protein
LTKDNQQKPFSKITIFGTPVDKPEDAQEALNWDFVKYIWNFDKKCADRLEMCKQKYPNVRFIEITSFRGMKRFDSQ